MYDLVTTCPFDFGFYSHMLADRKADDILWIGKLEHEAIDIWRQLLLLGQWESLELLWLKEAFYKMRIGICDFVAFHMGRISW